VVSGLILWDLDGTLLRWTAGQAYESSHEAVVREGFRGQVSPVAEARGLTDYELLMALVPCPFLPPAPCSDDLADLLAELDQRCVGRDISGSLCANPELLAVVADAELLGWRNLIMTGNTRARAEWKLSSVGLLGAFDWDNSAFGSEPLSRAALCAATVVRCGERFGPSIPVVVVGDSRRDIAAAKLAGVPIVATTWAGDSSADLSLWGADLVVGDGGLSGRDLLEWLRKASGSQEN
jgi:phosphoglycolate phosphatase